MTGVPALFPVHDVASAWPFVSSEIAELARANGEQWTAAHALAELLAGRAMLWALPDLSGFVVTCVVVQPWERSLLVWIACNSIWGSAAEFIPQIQAIARRYDCQRFEWESPRPGYQRAFEGVKTRYLYSMEA